MSDGAYDSLSPVRAQHCSCMTDVQSEGSDQTRLGNLDDIEKAVTGAWLTWHQVHVSVEVAATRGPDGGTSKQAKTLIHSSSGSASPGELVAVFGPSGAGKTSLFNSLAKRGRGYSVTGDILLNGMPYVKRSIKNIAGFVFQESEFRSHLTVIETLRISAMLKMPRSATHGERESRCHLMLDRFDLRKCEATRVGDSKVKGISGGEKKRLSIAIEVLNGPSLLFLDEPTTGLDAASAHMVLKYLRELADDGCTIITVLHQPRQSILEYVDKILLLSDGRDVFFGSLDNLYFFFETVGLPIPIRTNPMDFALDAINTNSYAEDDPSTGGRDQLRKSSMSHEMGALLGAQASLHKAEAFEEEDQSMPELAKMDRRELALLLSAKFRESPFAGSVHLSDAPDFAALPPLMINVQSSAFRVRLMALLEREGIQKMRNPEVLVTQIGAGVILGLVMGSIFYQMPTTPVFNIASSIAFSLMLCLFMCFHIILLFPTERYLWLRDRDNGLYNSVEYYFSNVIAGMPGDIVGPIILSSILYWMFGLRPTASAFFTFMGFCILTVSTASALMMVSGTLAPTPGAANSIISFLTLFIILFNGFFIVYYTIPPWYYWIAVVNFMRFAVQSLLYNQFQGQLYNCTGLSECVESGDQILVALGVPVPLNLWLFAIYMLICWVVFHIIGCTLVTVMYTGQITEWIDDYRATRAPAMRTLTTTSDLDIK